MTHFLNLCQNEPPYKFTWALMKQPANLRRTALYLESILCLSYQFFNKYVGNRLEGMGTFLLISCVGK